jgi:hypothetical protein
MSAHRWAAVHVLGSGAGCGQVRTVGVACGVTKRILNIL